MSEPSGIPPESGPRRPTQSPLLIAIVRVLLLLGAAGAVATAVVIRFRDHGAVAGGARYVCPMHPEVRSAEPGQCPICSMALEPTALGKSDAGPGGSGPTSRMAGMADMVAVENVRKHRILDFVRMRSLILNLRVVRAPAWVGEDGAITALLYGDQVAALAPDEAGFFSPTEAPEQRLAVERTDEPVVAWDRATAKVRFRFRRDPGGSSRRPVAPEQAGWLDLGTKARNVLAVPASAILQSPEGPYVLTPQGEMTFTKRPIEIGETYLREGFAVVLSGLRAQEKVVGKATFFLDADRRLGASAGDPARGGL